MALGHRVRDLRLGKNLGQAELCALTGGALTQQTLDRLEKRDSKTSEAAPRLADALGVSLRWLLTGEGRRDEADWPFKRVDRARWDRCSDEDRGYIQAAMNKALDECEALLGGAGTDREGRGPTMVEAA